MSTTRTQPDKGTRPEDRKQQRRKECDALDEALEESFPASDPPAATQPDPRGPAGDPATKP